MSAGNRFNLNSIEVNALVDFFLYYATPEDRRKLATFIPGVYAKIAGGVIVQSIHNTGEPPS